MRASTQRAYQYHLQPFADAFKSRRFGTIRPGDLNRLLEGRQTWGDATKHCAFNLITAVWRWARDAGFAAADIEATWDTWRYSGQRAEQFSKSHGGRISQPGFLGTAEAKGFATREEVAQISETWFKWGVTEDAFIAMPCAEILCRKN